MWLYISKYAHHTHFEAIHRQNNKIHIHHIYFRCDFDGNLKEKNENNLSSTTSKPIQIQILFSL